MVTELNIVWCVVSVVLFGCVVGLYYLRDKLDFMTKHQYVMSMWLVGISTLFIVISMAMAWYNTSYPTTLFVALASLYPLWNVAASTVTQVRREKFVDTSFDKTNWFTGLGFMAVFVTVTRVYVLSHSLATVWTMALSIAVFVAVDILIIWVSSILYHESLSTDEDVQQEEYNAIA